jgi:DNA polymerase
MSWKGFQSTFHNRGQECSDEYAQDAVAGYRSLYAEAPQAWYDLADAARLAITEKTPQRYLRTRFEVRDGFLFMRLPSGRELAYYAPRIEIQPAPWDPERKIEAITHMGYKNQGKLWCRMNLIPGRIMENLVQATTRDLMMRGALAVEAAGYDPVGRVHDEVISERPEGEGSLAEYCRLLATPPAWYYRDTQSIPIPATGWAGKRYRKD